MKEKILNNFEIGERIREIRKKLQMNREMFSEMIDISDVFLGQIERGERSLSLNTLCKISIFTGVSTDYIVFGTAENNSTRNKINRILDKTTAENVDYIYSIINCTNAFLKNHLNTNK